jgi:hypothetical protein
MKLDPPLQQQVLIDHVLKHGLRETVAPQRNRIGARDFLDNLGVAQKLYSHFYLRLPCRYRIKQSHIEAGADHRSFLRQPAHLMRQPIQPRQQQRLDARRDISRGFIRLDPPLRSVTLQGASFDETADDLLEEKRIAARALQDAAKEMSRWLIRPEPN